MSTPFHAGRVYLGWQYALAQPDPGPPPRRPVPPGQEQLNPGWLAAQRREERLLSRPWKAAVGGCLAQKDQGKVLERAPWVDVVFGTHNIGSLPALLDRARHNRRA